MVLHLVQPLGGDLAAAFPAERFEARILTGGPPEDAVRPWVPTTVPVESAPPESWAERLRELAGRGRLEVVTNDEYCLERCAALRREFGLPPRLVVLETAARAPGGLVSDIAVLHIGVHLEQLNLMLQAGEPAALPAPTDVHAAWLWFPRTGQDRRPRAPRCEHRLEALPPTSPIAWSLLAWDPDPERLREEALTAGTRSTS